MFELWILAMILIGAGGIAGEVSNKKSKSNLPEITEEKIERMEKQLDQLHAQAKEQLRRIR
jgi:ribosome recycling factor